MSVELSHINPPKLEGSVTHEDRELATKYLTVLNTLAFEMSNYCNTSCKRVFLNRTHL